MWYNSTGFDCQHDGIIAKIGVSRRHRHEVSSDCRIVEDFHWGSAYWASDGGGRGAYLNFFRCTSYTHFLLMIAINSLMGSLRNCSSKGSEGVTRTSGHFWHEYFEVFLNSLKKSSLKYNRFEGWKPSSRSVGLGEGLSKSGTCLALAEETSSWLGLGSTWLHEGVLAGEDGWRTRK
jgi:hypothetical protein